MNLWNQFHSFLLFVLIGMSECISYRSSHKIFDKKKWRFSIALLRTVINDLVLEFPQKIRAKQSTPKKIVQNRKTRPVLASIFSINCRHQSKVRNVQKIFWISQYQMIVAHTTLILFRLRWKFPLNIYLKKRRIDIYRTQYCEIGTQFHCDGMCQTVTECCR